MPIYSIAGPEGKTYRIEGPEGATRDQVVKAIKARMQVEEDVARQERMRQPISPPQGESGFFENVATGFGAGAVNMGELTSLGAAALLEEDTELAAREKIQSAANYLRPEGGDPESIAYQLSSGLGSIAGLAAPAVAAAYAGAPALAVTAGTGLLAMGAGAGEASERAREAGVSEDVRNTATLKGAAVGTLDVLPISRAVKALKVPLLTNLVDKLGPKSVERLRDRVYNASVTGGLEGAQEAASNILQNLIEQGYNPEQELTEGAAHEGAIGAGSGAILQAMVDLFAKKSRGRTPPAGEAAPENVDGELGDTQLGMFDDVDVDLEALEKLATQRNVTQAEAEEATTAEQVALEELQDIPIQSDMFLDEEGRATEGQLELLDTSTVQQEGIVTPPEDTALPDIGGPQQLDLVSEIDTLETNELEGMLEADRVAAKEVEQAKIQQDTAALDNKRALEQAQDTEQKRRDVLLSVVEESRAQDHNIVTKDFQTALAATGFRNTTPTETELATIKRSTDVRNAQAPVVKPAVTAIPEQDLGTTAMEAVIPERKTTVEPHQPTLEGVQGKKAGKKQYGQRLPATSTDSVISAPITEEQLDTAKIPKAAPVRKRVLGKDMDNVEDAAYVKAQLTEFANNPKVSGEVK